MIGIIYIIIHNDNDVYLGKTTKTLKSRITQYKNEYNNDNHKNYNFMIHQFLRKKGFDKVEFQLVKPYVIDKPTEINPYFCEWVQAYREAGYNILNKRGLTSVHDQEAKKSYYKEKTECHICGTVVSNYFMRRHRETNKCQYLKVLNAAVGGWRRPC